jgi:two-component system nitrogen regulation response regulator GlnG
MPSTVDILVIEDDPTIGRLLKDIFTLAGRAVRLAPNIAAANARLSEARPALITLDLNMPGMSGQTFLEGVCMRPEMCGIPVIVITSQLPVEHIVTQLAAAVVAKPFDLDELLAALERVLPGSGLLAV